jgi:hypothetical protein
MMIKDLSKPASVQKTSVSGERGQQLSPIQENLPVIQKLLEQNSD